MQTASNNPICHQCGSEVLVEAGGFIGRADLAGMPDMLFVVYCQICGEHANASRGAGRASLTALSEMRRSARRSKLRTRRAAG